MSNETTTKVPKKLVQQALIEVLVQYKTPPSEVSVMLTTDEVIQGLNRDFRSLDEPTDVLTFPGGPFGPLGDIAISVDTAQRQADARRDSLAHEIVFLTIHGGLHLLGYEDETDEGRDDMVVRMNSVAESLGIPVDPDWSSLPHGENK